VAQAEQHWQPRQPLQQRVSGHAASPARAGGDGRVRGRKLRHGGAGEAQEAQEGAGEAGAGADGRAAVEQYRLSLSDGVRLRGTRHATTFTC
jgi:hypothetical protein